MFSTWRVFNGNKSSIILKMMSLGRATFTVLIYVRRAFILTKHSPIWSNSSGNNHLVVFGGMSNQPDSTNPEELCVLNDVRFYDLSSRHWLPATPPSTEPDPFLPRARYAHLSSVTADRLFVIGGQDFFNTWLDDICVFDLVSRTWVQRRDYPRHCGTYRSVAVSSHMTVRFPQEEMQASLSASTLGPVGSRFRPAKSTSKPEDVTPSDNLIHQPYSVSPTEDHPSDVYLYSNYNVSLSSVN